MNDFISKFSDRLSGILTGFDRMVFRGGNCLNHAHGMKGYLWAHDVKLKDFGAHAEAVSGRVREAAVAAVLSAGRPIIYLNSGKDDKQQIAAALAAKDGIRQGPICALKAVELCRSYAIRSENGRLRLEASPRKCLFVYQYWMDPVFGFMSARLQTWFPFPIYIYRNGREWLARQMDQAGVPYRRHDNCFTWVEDFARAQALMDEQVKVNWAAEFDSIAARLNPVFSELAANYPMQYRWTCSDSERAMDLVFRDADVLRRLYPQLLHLGMISFSSPDVLRFMGKKVSRQGAARGGYELPNTTDLKVRSQGVRIKHRLGPNSLKLSDKAYDELGAVLRAEITITEPKYFRVFRPGSNANSAPDWRPLRRSTADIVLRGEVSQKALDVYCSALAAVDDSATLEQLTAMIERRVRWHKQTIRALHPFDPHDHALLQAINRGEFSIDGLRNRDLQNLLYSGPARNRTEHRRRSAAISRKLRLLRAHGLLRKLPHTHRYQVTKEGRVLLNALLSAYHTTVRQFMAAAA